ncbi:hypothetical protein D3C76_1823750 [compost metagenome]
MQNCIQHRFVFNLAGNNVATLPPMSNAFEGKVIGLGRSRGPDDLLSIGTDKCGNLGTGLLHCQPRLLAIAM